jgi:hypothetical protein
LDLKEARVMDELHKAFPPIPLRDHAPAICLGIALLGLVLGALVVASRIDPAHTQVAINAEAAPR